MSRKNIITGSIGEFYTAAKLAEKGWTVTLTTNNNPDIDLLVTDGASTKAVQVKTAGKPKADWPCPVPKTISKDLVYIFVVLQTKAGTLPDFYIVPSADADKIIKRISKEYMDKHTKSSKTKGVPKIWFKTEAEAKPYKNRWDNLCLKVVDTL